jgi:hypothetical protein
MNAKSRWAVVCVGALVASSFVIARAQQAGEPLGSVRLPRSVLANGQPLPAGTYSARLSNDPVTRVVGQSADSSRWVEFVAGGQVRGRELATVVAPADVKEVAKGTPPPQGTARVQALRGADYLRVWFNRAGTQYLIHFNVAK